MTTLTPVKFLIGAVIALLIAACGSSGGGGIASGGTGGTGISFGTITDFGSIIVNGSRLDDSTATVTLDDNPGSGIRKGLKQGMVVNVSGAFSGNTGTASSIEFRDNLEGAVCAKSTVGEITTLRVLGQTVIVDATTFIDNNATINAGDIIEVSGLPDDQERIRASFIEKKLPIDAAIEVKGRIDAVGASTLTINALVVDITPATIIDNSIPGGSPAVGQFVEVKGTAYACGGATDTLTATKIELEPAGAGAITSGVHAEIEGFITELVGGGFKIGSQQIATQAGTLYLPDDFSAADILVGAKVEAEGTFANGVLTASKISFRQNVKLESTVASGNSVSFSLLGLPGIVVKTNSATDFRNGIVIAPGVHLRVRGIEGPGNTVLATRIEPQGGSTVFLQGPVDTVANPNLTILGITVDTSPINVFQDVNDNLIARATFFSSVQPGTLVKIKGDWTGAVVTWDEVELED